MMASCCYSDDGFLLLNTLAQCVLGQISPILRFIWLCDESLGVLFNYSVGLKNPPKQVGFPVFVIIFITSQLFYTFYVIQLFHSRKCLC